MTQKYSKLMDKFWNFAELLNRSMIIGKKIVLMILIRKMFFTGIGGFDKGEQVNS